MAEDRTKLSPPDVIRFCPYCGYRAARDRKTLLYDCASMLCRVRFNVSYSRRKRATRKRASP